MRHKFKDERLRFYLGDTRDPFSVEAATRGAKLVFHAAALKQVPSAEFFPLEAVKTNINGSANVLHAAIEAGVSSVVCLSTDKAVYPINAMGMSKALMEKTAMSFARRGYSQATRIAVTRYGNVMYSRGSVLPLFISQIRAGKPITITDPRMTRFLMSLAESVDLVDFAFKNAVSGDLFVRKAPAATLQVLAEALLELFDAKNREIVEIGFRHGEKLFESLLSTEERAFAIDMGDYFRVPLDTRDLNYGIFSGCLLQCRAIVRAVFALECGLPGLAACNSINCYVVCCRCSTIDNGLQRVGFCRLVDPPVCCAVAYPNRKVTCCTYI
jgi:UDP-glucose 4-epimerase